MKTFLQTLFFIFLVTQICFGQWYQQTSGTTATLYSIHFVDANNGWAVGGNWFYGSDSSLILHTTNAGAQWAKQESGTEIPIVSVYFIDIMNGWAVGGCSNWDDSLEIHNRSGIILHTTNGGIHWETQWQVGNLFIPKSVFFIDSLTGWATGTSWPSDWHPKSSIWHTLDGGVTWQNQFEGDLETSMASVFFNNSLIGWAVGDSYTSSVNPPILHTTDGGVHWTSLEGLTPGWEAISVQFTDANNGWIIGHTSYCTTDGGINWFNNGPSVGRYEHQSSASFVDSKNGCIVGYTWDDHGIGKGHISLTINGGSSWTTEYFGQDTAFYGCCFVDPLSGWVVGSNGLILHTANGGISSVETENKLPLGFALSQNYPNPFNPSTKIKYSVPQTSRVQIKVYDVLGNEVATLVNEEKPAGVYEANWNAANLSSGVYFYQIKAGNYVETKKMILMK